MLLLILLMSSYVMMAEGEHHVTPDARVARLYLQAR